MNRPYLRIIGIEDSQLIGPENSFHKIIDIFLNLRKDMPTKAQEENGKPNRWDQKRKSPHHVLSKQCTYRTRKED